MFNKTGISNLSSICYHLVVSVATALQFRFLATGATNYFRNKFFYQQLVVKANCSIFVDAMGSPFRCSAKLCIVLMEAVFSNLLCLYNVCSNLNSTEWANSQDLIRWEHIGSGQKKGIIRQQISLYINSANKRKLLCVLRGFFLKIILRVYMLYLALWSVTFRVSNFGAHYLLNKKYVLYIV